MKSLLVYLKNYKKESVLAPLFKMLEAIFELIVPLVVASIIDTGIANGDIKFIITRCGILVVLAIVGMVAAITAQFFAAKAATGFSKELRHSLFKKIQSLSFSELDTVGASSLITRLTSDVTQIQNGVNIVLRLFLRSPFIVFGAMIMAFTVDVKSALTFVIIIPILSIIVFGIMIYTIPKYKTIQQNLDGITLKTRENLSGARVIRAFNQEENEVSSFNEKNRILSGFQKGVGKISALMNPVTYIVINIGIVMIINSGAIQVNAGKLSQGDVVALYNYMSQILVELIKLANLIITVTKVFPCASRVQNIFELENTLQKNNDTEVKTENAVDFKNVSFCYDGSLEESLTNISFSAKRGEVIGIVGSTGSGKTSLVSLIPHFYDVIKGSVLVNGKDVKSYDSAELRSKIGFVLQKAVLFKGSIRENLRWGNENATDDDMLDALYKAQVIGVVQEKGGLDADIEQNGANLSGGQKQRLSIARALVRKPEILIFDDSSSALDLGTEANLIREIYSLEYKPTVFIVSQRTNSVIDADKIIVLEDGEAVAIGNHSDLLENCDVYREIYESQFGKENDDEK